MHRANRAGRWTYRIRPAVGSRGCAPCRVWRFSARPEQGSRAAPLPIFAYFLSAEKVWPGFGAAAPMPVQIISLRIYFAEYGEPIQADGRWPSLHPSDGNAAPNPPNKSFPFIIPHPRYTLPIGGVLFPTKCYFVGSPFHFIDFARQSLTKSTPNGRRGAIAPFPNTPSHTFVLGLHTK